MIRKILLFFLLAITSQLTLAQAPGPDCTSATPLTLFPGTTISTGLQTVAGQGNSYPVGTSNVCSVNGLHGNAEDGVYSINVTIAGDYTFAFANTVGATVWNSLAVHSGCPPNNGNCLDTTRGFVTGTQRDGSTTTTLTPGTYYILIDSFVTVTPAASFELLITTPISNDECIDPVELFGGIDCTYVTYTNVGATASAGAPAPACANYQDGDVWFSYEVGPTGEFTVTTEADVMTDSGMEIYSGPCGGLSRLACNDDFGTGGMSSITLTGRTPGEIVYVRIWGYGASNYGTFGICVTVPIPPGDNGVFSDCPNERSKELTSDFVCPPGVNTSDVVFGNLQGGSLADRLNTSVVNTTVCGFAGGSTRRYEEIDFTVPVDGFYVLEMTSATFDSQGYIVESGFTPGNCGSGTFVIGDDDSGPGLLSELSVNLLAGVNYTLVTTEWGGPGSGNSPYTWTVTSGPDINWLTTIAIDWYTSAVGGTSIKTGPNLNPVNFPGSGLTDTGTPGIYPFWYECSSNPGVRTRVDYVIGKAWYGTTSSDWGTASNWSNNELPTTSQCVVIPAGSLNEPVISDNYNADGLNITIDAGATLTLASDLDANGFGSSLTIQDNINAQGTLIVQDGASLIQVNDTPSIANSGNILVNRDADISRTDYVYWSSPVQNFARSDIYGGFTPLSYIFEWIPTIPNGIGPGPDFIPICYGNWALNSSGAMNLGKGYAVRGPSNFTAAVSTASVTFDGVPNNGVITQPISSGTNSSLMNYLYSPYGVDMLTVTRFDDNWNLLGNPYPSALDADSFLMHPSNNIIEGAVHIWTHGSQIGSYPDSFYDDYTLSYNILDYKTYNLTGTNTYTDETFGGKIASGQGFFVLALNDSESGSVTFNNSMRDRTHSNTEFYRTANSNENISDSNGLERNRIWLNLVDQNGTTSSTLVGYVEGATQEKDRLFDAYIREVNSLSLYSKIEDERVIIQGRALPFDENDQVALGTVIPQAGEYTIAISNLDGLFLDDNQKIYLEDTYTGAIHNLRAAPYTFTETSTERVDYGDRFLLRYTDDALSIADFDLSTLNIIAPKGDYIKINSESSPIHAVTVYDLLGRSLIDNLNIDASEFVINDHKLSSGTYIVKVILSNGVSKTQKVILNR